MIGRLAARNLVRHRWRSSLTAGGVALAVGLLIWLSSWIASITDTMIATATESGVGHIRVQAAAGELAPALHDVIPATESELASLEEHPDVALAAPRIANFGLLGDEDQSQAVEIIGVDPGREDDDSGFGRSVTQGAWLSESAAELGLPREGVIGHGLASILGAQIGDELVVFTQAADGSLGNDIVEITGIARTGRSDLDRGGLLLHREDAEFLLALDGEVHEIAITTPELDQIPGAVDRIAAAIPGVFGVEVHRRAGPEADEGAIVETWYEIVPELAAMMDVATAAAFIIYIFIFGLAAVGIVNTQRMSVLERQREFGVALAVGMAPRRLGALIVTETVLLVGVGVLAGIALGVGAVVFVGQVGIDPSVFTAYEGDISVFGVAFGEPMYTRLRDAEILQPALLMGALAVIFALPAALRATRLDAVRAISGRT